MTHADLAASCLRSARRRLPTLDLLLASEGCNDVVRGAQDIVELAGKAKLRAIGSDPPDVHDVGERLRRGRPGRRRPQRPNLGMLRPKLTGMSRVIQAEMPMSGCMATDQTNRLARSCALIAASMVTHCNSPVMAPADLAAFRAEVSVETSAGQVADTLDSGMADAAPGSDTPAHQDAPASHDGVFAGCLPDPAHCSHVCKSWGHCALCPATMMCVPTPEGCWNSETCKFAGGCTVWGGDCQAVPTPAAQCEQTWACAYSGYCGLWPDGTCKATAKSACAQSKLCAELGDCDQVNNHPYCLPTKDAHCEQSAACKANGRCAIGFQPKDLASQRCVPKTEAHCLQSTGCAQSGNCKFVASANGSACVNATADCTKGCAEFGTCGLDARGACEPTEPKHCADAAVCKAAGKCIRSPYLSRCLSKDEVFHP